MRVAAWAIAFVAIISCIVAFSSFVVVQQQMQ